MAWWGSGWGVWRGEEPDLTAPPVYATGNLTHAAPEAASSWALGVVPSHPRLSVQCRFRGDPDGEAKFIARMRERQSRPWWRRLFA